MQVRFFVGLACRDIILFFSRNSENTQVADTVPIRACDVCEVDLVEIVIRPI